MTIIFNPSCDD